MLIKNLTITDLKNHQLLDHFSFTLGVNDKVGIIGEEGNGKSTLLKAIYKPEMIEDYSGMSGSIDTQNQTLGYFPQQLENQWDSVFVWEYLLKEEVHDEIKDYNELALYQKECIRYTIDPELVTRDQKMESLSGGEKVKLRLLKVLHHKYDVLLLDEPTNDLDIPTLEWLEQLLLHLPKPIMFISHDERLLQTCANVILHIEQRNKKTKCVQTVFRGTYQEYQASRQLKLAKDCQLAKKEKSDYQKKQQKLNDIQNAVHDALNDCVRNPGQAAKLAKKMKNIKAREGQMKREGYSHVDTVEEAIDVYFPAMTSVKRKVILEMQGECVRIAQKELITDITLKIMGQDKIVFIGKNGCGKTLLIQKIYKILKNRTDLHLGYMPQNYQDGFSSYMTPIDFLSITTDLNDITSSRELLGRMKFTTEEMEHELKELSEGQKAKLYILKLVKSKCDVLLLDEPTRNLSPLSGPMIRHIFKQYPGCIISVSHDRSYIEEVGKTCYEIIEGKLVQR